MVKTREENIASLMWSFAPGDPRARYGGGTWEIDPEVSIYKRTRDGATWDDWKSTVCVGAPASQYSDAELEAIARFAERATCAYDRLFPRGRRGMNYIVIEKRRFMGDAGAPEWFRARVSWYTGPMYSAQLGDALAVWPEFAEKQECQVCGLRKRVYCHPTGLLINPHVVNGKPCDGSNLPPTPAYKVKAREAAHA